MKEIKLKDIIFVKDTKLTIRGYRRRTTVPKEVIDRLKLNDKSNLRWIVLKDGSVIVVNATLCMSCHRKELGGGD